MDRLDRLIQLDKLLKSHRFGCEMSQLKEDLRCSKSTVKRALQDLKEYFDAPIFFDPQHNKYRYQSDQEFILPGVWFSAKEIAALLLIEQLLSDIQPGMFKDLLSPIQEKLQKIHQKLSPTTIKVGQVIKLVGIGQRIFEPQYFQILSESLLQKKQVKLGYHDKTRQISPIKLLNYKNSWYLDAFDHDSHQFKSFALDKIQTLNLSQDTSNWLQTDYLETYYESAYGLFTGQANQYAIIRLNSPVPAWLKNQQWHPAQTLKPQENGDYLLEIPYNKTPELLSDLMKYHYFLKIEKPQSLVTEFKTLLTATLNQYD